MYHTTGLRKDDVAELCVMLHERFDLTPKKTGRRPVLGVFKSVKVTLAYLRRNYTQAELAEMYDTSQSTISRAIARFTPLLGQILTDWIPTADDLDPAVPLLIDGTLLPCWSWQAHPELWSGKHRTTGMNVQVACYPSGRLAWISDPTNGSTHDARAIRATGVLEGRTGGVGDKGYIGTGMITPIRRPPGDHLREDQKAYNKAINSVRAAIERTIAHLKTWRILHTDYRRPLETIPDTITIVIGL